MDGFYRPGEGYDNIFDTFKQGYSSDEEIKEQIYESLREEFGSRPISSSKNRPELNSPEQIQPPLISQPTTPLSDEEFRKIIENGETSSKSVESTSLSSGNEFNSQDSMLERNPWAGDSSSPKTHPPIITPQKTPYLYGEPNLRDGLFTPPMHLPLPTPPPLATTNYPLCLFQLDDLDGAVAPVVWDIPKPEKSTFLLVSSFFVRFGAEVAW